MTDLRSMSPRTRWSIAAAAAIAWAVARSTTGRDVFNPGGWDSFAEFWASVADPELAIEFLRTTADATSTTASFAVLGTVVSVVVGLLAGPLVSERVWESGDRRRSWTWVRRVVRGIVRLAFVVPRAVHEVIGALLLIQIFGFDPWVAILAIGVQFGAVTTKVYGELIDDADPRAFRALRAAGASRIAALSYGIAPAVRRDVVSYGFYRLECAVRSAAVLGIIGAGGLGFQLDLSFESLRYEEIWTLIIALMILSGLADAWSSKVRHDATSRAQRRSWLLVVASIPIAAWHVDLRPNALWSARSRRLAGDLIGDLLPPRLGPGGWGELASATIDTLAMSMLATVIAVVGGIVAATVAARPWRRPVPFRSRAAGGVTRLILLLFRAVPAPVWAFLVVLVMFPGIWPGAVALGVYNLGVLGRLFAEVFEDHDDRARRQLATTGASSVQQLTYAVLPTTAPRLAALALYRWEVITRETVVVGVVGAGGIGRLIQEHLVARDFAAVLGAIGGLVVLTALIDVTSARLRRSLR